MVLISTGRFSDSQMETNPGKGPQREYYLDLIQNKTWNHTQVITMWLTAENYPKFLGTLASPATERVGRSSALCPQVYAIWASRCTHHRRAWIYQ